MFDIGLEVIRPKYEVPANWSMEQGIGLFNSLNDNLTTISNLIVVRNSIRKYGKTQQLKDLVGASFEGTGISFSVEGVTDSIKKFFKWVKEKIAALWRWVKGFVTHIKKKTQNTIAKLKTIKNNIKNMSKDTIVEYDGVDIDRVMDWRKEFSKFVDNYNEAGEQISTLEPLLPQIEKLKNTMREYHEFKPFEINLKDCEEEIDMFIELAGTDKVLKEYSDGIKYYEEYIAKYEPQLKANPNDKTLQQCIPLVKLQLKVFSNMAMCYQFTYTMLNKSANNLSIAFQKKLNEQKR